MWHELALSPSELGIVPIFAYISTGDVANSVLILHRFIRNVLIRFESLRLDTTITGNGGL